MKKARILIVDDEEDLCEILKFNLEGEGFEVDEAYSAEDAITKRLDKYDLLLLDVMMGKMSGFKLAEKIRKERGSTIPIIFLTAKDTKNDTLTGFSIGADDYISKPFSIKEVVARVNAVLNRTTGKYAGEQIINVEGMEFDLNKKKLIIDNKSIYLTRKEFEILQLLIENQGRIFSREEVLNYVCKYETVVTTRTVDVNIARIRKKMGKYGKFVRSRTGYGYYFDIQ
jgi:DNA-binding response OmpR family regulator